MCMRMHVGYFGGGSVAFYFEGGGALSREQTFVLSAARAPLITHVTVSVVTVYEKLCTTLPSVFL